MQSATMPSMRQAILENVLCCETISQKILQISRHRFQSAYCKHIFPQPNIPNTKTSIMST